MSSLAKTSNGELTTCTAQVVEPGPVKGLIQRQNLCLCFRFQFFEDAVRLGLSAAIINDYDAESIRGRSPCY